jgi:hypothetical protein
MDWSTAGLMRRLRLPEDFVPSDSVEAKQIYERCVDLLLAPGTKSGYKEVYSSATKGKWQAKPYVGPKKQRNLGTFETARAAAEAILDFKRGGRCAPSPQKERNKRGQGARARDRRKGAYRCQSHCMLLPSLTCCECCFDRSSWCRLADHEEAARRLHSCSEQHQFACRCASRYEQERLVGRCMAADSCFPPNPDGESVVCVWSVSGCCCCDCGGRSDRAVALYYISII